MISCEVDTSLAPSALSHGQFTEDNLIKPDYRLIQIICLLKVLDYESSLQREIGYLKGCPCLLYMNHFPPQTVLEIQITQSCLGDLLLGKLH
jgi:hypothetical protein